MSSLPTYFYAGLTARTAWPIGNHAYWGHGTNSHIIHDVTYDVVTEYLG